MLVYGVADIHGRRGRIELIGDNIEKHRPDVLVVAGDITGLADASKTVAALNDMPVPVPAVRGNFDPGGVDRLLEESSNTRSLHLNRVDVRGVSFVGVSGTIPLPFHTRVCIGERSVMKEIEPLVDGETVLVAHTPSLGTLDKAAGLFDSGSRRLRDLVAIQQPRVMIAVTFMKEPAQPS